MASGTLVSLEHYLSTSYQPDREYVDGELLERAVGELDHGGLQSFLVLWLMSRRQSLGINVLIETRTQVSPTRYRVPDIAVITARPKGRILALPPFICIEILSPEDRISRVEEKIDDYLKFGVPYVWLIDPRKRSAWAYTSEGKSQCPDVLTTVNPTIELPIKELFAELYDVIDPE